MVMFLFSLEHVIHLLRYHYEEFRGLRDKTKNMHFPELL